MSVSALDPARLRRDGFRVVLVDLDNTLVPRDSEAIPDESARWVDGLKAEGLSGGLLSNNWHERVNAIAGALGLVAIPRALKPLPFAFRRAFRELSVEPEHVVVVGDQIFTDVLGGNLVGATTVLVDPLAGSDLPHTVLLRRAEAAIMAGREPTERVDTLRREEPNG
jgi:HAD superfamily phosphatase (TIGR01668 family)